jgi:hypothetical protein
MVAPLWAATRMLVSMTDGGGPSSPSGGPPARKAGWYRDRNTGERRFWNGATWFDIPSAITPFTYEPEGAVVPGAPVAPATPAAPPPEEPKRSIDPRIKLVGFSVAVVVLILAIVGVIELMSGSGAEPASTNDAVSSGQLPSDTGDASATTSPFGSTTSAPPTNAVVGATGVNPATSPGGTSPGVTSPGVTSPATTLPVATSPGGTGAAGANPSGNVAIVGDSITNLARSDLTHDLRHYNLYLDAIGATTMAQHLAKIEHVATDGQSWDWVVELGTNDALPYKPNPNWASDFAHEVDALATQPCVVFVTVNPRFGSIAQGINQAIAHAVASHPNFHTLDWGDMEFRKPEWLRSDGIHPSTSGAVELAKLMHEAIRGCQGQ